MTQRPGIPWSQPPRILWSSAAEQRRSPLEGGVFRIPPPVPSSCPLARKWSLRRSTARIPHSLLRAVSIDLLTREACSIPLVAQDERGAAAPGQAHLDESYSGVAYDECP